MKITNLKKLGVPQIEVNNICFEICQNYLSHDEIIFQDTSVAWDANDLRKTHMIFCNFINSLTYTHRSIHTHTPSHIHTHILSSRT